MVFKVSSDRPLVLLLEQGIKPATQEYLVHNHEKACLTKNSYISVSSAKSLFFFCNIFLFSNALNSKDGCPMTYLPSVFFFESYV
jgi:hypothetical protein